MDEHLPGFHTRAEILRDRTRRDIENDLRDGTLARPRPGAYVDSTSWSESFPEERQRLLAAEAQRRSAGRLIFSHETAAALWGLPLFRATTDRVHTVSSSAAPAPSNSHVFRHGDTVSPHDIVERSGLVLTSLSRTVYDVARTVREETAVCVADAALRAAARDGATATRRDRAESLRDEIIRTIAHHPGARGIRRARRIVELADAESESPGESVSRLYLLDLGHRPVRTQVPFRGPNGEEYRIDFAFSGVFGEFDGAMKYLDEELRQGRTAEQVLLQEKRREDAIRAVSGRRVIRWGMSELASRDAFRRYLRRLNVVPRRDNA